MPAVLQKKTTEKISTVAAVGRKSASWKAFAAILFQALIVLIAGILAIELAFGLAGIWEQDHLIPNREIGISIMPNRKITFRNEGFSRRTFNSFGMANREISEKKPANTFRIAVVGDSMIEALQVDLSKTMCSRLEQQLNDIDSVQGKKVEVLNFGVSASNVGQSYLRLKKLALRFQPDLVIMYVRDHATSDLPLPLNARFPFAARPHFFVANNGAVYESRLLFDSWWNSKEARNLRAAQWLRMHSHVWSCLVNMQFRLVTGMEQLKAEAVSKTKGLISVLSLSKPDTPTENSAEKAAAAAAADPNSELNKNIAIEQIKCVRHYFAVMERLLAAMKQECAKNNCKFAVVYIGATDNAGLEEHKLLRESMAKKNIPLMDFTDEFQTEKKKRPLYFVDPGHFNIAGNQLFADLIGSYLVSNKQFLLK